MILQDAARRNRPGPPDRSGLGPGTGQRRAGNGADADAGATRIGVAGHPRARAKRRAGAARHPRPARAPAIHHAGGRDRRQGAAPGRDRGRRVQEGPAAGAIRLQPATGPAEQGPCRPERRRQDLARQPAPGAAQFGGQGRTGDLAGGSAEGRRRGGREQGAAGQVPRDRALRGPRGRAEDPRTAVRAAGPAAAGHHRRYGAGTGVPGAVALAGLARRARRSRCASTRPARPIPPRCNGWPPGSTR